MKKASLLLAILCLVKFLLPFLLQNGVYEPHRDEFLYFEQGKHFGWGYMENPPLLSWLTLFFPKTFFAIKFWPALFGSLTFLLTAKMALGFGGRRFSVILVFFAFVFGAFLRTFFLYQPNAPEIFFCTLAAFALQRYILRGTAKWIYLMVIALALGLLSKYSVAFFGFSVLVALSLTPYRKIFVSRHFYNSLLIGLLLLLPNILWQIQHDFPFFRHMEELKETQLRFVDPVGFLFGQMLMHLTVIYLWIGGLLFAAFSRAGRPWRVYAFTYIILLCLLLIFQGKAYYMLCGYSVLFSLGAVWFENVTLKRPVLKYACLAYTIGFGLLVLPRLLPVFSPGHLQAYYKKYHVDDGGGFKWEDQQKHPLPQDFADMLGWEEMTTKTASAYNSLTEEQRVETILFCGNYGQAGAINFYGKKWNLPEAMSANGSFKLWMKERDYQNLILIIDGDPLRIESVLKLAGSYEVFAAIKNPLSREYGSSILLVKNTGHAFKEAVNNYLK